VLGKVLAVTDWGGEKALPADGAGGVTLGMSATASPPPAGTPGELGAGSANADGPALPRKLGLWSAIAVVAGITIGSGIFRTPASVTNRLPGPAALFAVWIAGGLTALCGALTLAEVAGAFPETGGIYVFIRRGYGRLPAFLFGWAELSIIRAAAVGAIATTFAEYFLRVLGFNPSVTPYDNWVHYVAALAIAVISILNYVGVRWGSLVQNVTTVAKYFGLLFIVLVAIIYGIPKTGGHFTPAAPPGSFGIAPFGLALVSVLWAYDGWADLAFISGEVKDPGRNLPLALIWGTVAVICIYLLANVAYLGVMSVDEIRHSKLVAADVALRLVGPAGVTFVAITVMLSTLGTLNGSVLRHVGGWHAVQEDLERAPALRDTVRGDHADRGAGDHLRAAADVRAARGHVCHGDPAVLRAGRGVDLRVPEKGRRGVPTDLSDTAVSVHADSVRVRDRVSAWERVDRSGKPLADARDLRNHRRGRADLLSDRRQSVTGALRS
jgi:basic amino acid/polyamine antiporter, APA family